MLELALDKDEKLTKPFAVEDIGRTKAGNTRIVKGYLSNNTIYDIVQIEQEIGDKDVTIQNVPEQLPPKSSIEVTITYSPSKQRREGLDTSVTFYGMKRIPGD